MPNDRLRVLVPLDGSPESEGILPALMPLVRSGPVKFTLLRVIRPNEGGASVQEYLARVRRALLLDGAVSDSYAEWGRPVEEILYYARPGWCDLIAMATHGRAGLRRALLGGVAEQVVRRARLPVIVSRPWTRIADWSRMVLALDGSARSEEVVADAVRLARLRRATVHVLGVVSPALRYADRAAAAIGPHGPSRDYLENVCDGLAAQGVMAVADLREGFPGWEIPRHAEETGAGLICMATHGRTGLARALMGSVAEIVLRTAPCPVFVRRTAAVGAARATA